MSDWGVAVCLLEGRTLALDSVAVFDSKSERDAFDDGLNQGAGMFAGDALTTFPLPEAIEGDGWFDAPVEAIREEWAKHATRGSR